MAEYIDRQKLLEDIRTDVAPFTVSMVFRHIRNAPAADMIPVKHGYWDDSLDGLTPYCSECRFTHRCLVRTPNYCPNCGAKMDLKE